MAEIFVAALGGVHDRIVEYNQHEKRGVSPDCCRGLVARQESKVRDVTLPESYAPKGTERTSNAIQTIAECAFAAASAPGRKGETFTTFSAS